MLCSSGMMSVMNGVSMLKANEVDLVLTGGVESMSQAGFYIPHQARYGLGLSALKAPLELKDILLNEGLTDPLTGELMGQETDRLAKEYGLARQELDEVAYLSHRRAAEATVKGYFAEEITPIMVKKQKSQELLTKDEGIRPETTPETLARLRPAFAEDGRLTAGNSSQISDGAAALILASLKAVEHYSLKPIGRILGSAWAAGESWRFAEAPIPAVRKLLAKLGLRIDDVDLFENNEAFALNSVIFRNELEVSYDKLNIFGGAIALGHPVGCSGTRIIVTLLNALAQRDGKLGLASLCHGTGGATAIAIERL
jgi:acetyl-CoA C-acetyltransferase